MWASGAKYVHRRPGVAIAGCAVPRLLIPYWYWRWANERKNIEAAAVKLVKTAGRTHVTDNCCNEVARQESNQTPAPQSKCRHSPTYTV